MSPLETALGPVARAGAGLAKRPSVSFEFSPPKGPKSEERPICTLVSPETSPEFTQRAR